MATMEDIILIWKKALQIEIEENKKQGGRKLPLFNGEMISRYEKEAIYWFRALEEARLPDGSPVVLRIQNEDYQGEVLSTNGYDLIVKIDSYNRKEIEEALLISESWELLVALTNRLQESLGHSIKSKRMARAISGKSKAKHPQAKNPLHEVILRAKYNPTTYIWGPPGTGKTYTLARMIARHYQSGKKILVLAQSNAAVDVLVEEIAKIVQQKKSWKSGEIVRYGFSTNEKLKTLRDVLSQDIIVREYPHLQVDTYSLGKGQYSDSELRKIRMQRKEKEGELAANAKVLGVTLAKAIIDPFVFKNEYDMIVVDEVSMAYIPQIAFAASLGKKLIVCGDFKQLAPIAQAKHRLVEKWLRNDIFKVTKIIDAVDAGLSHPNLFMLKTQRRMHPDISSFTNQFIYKNMVSDDKAMVKKREQIVHKLPFPNEASVLVDTSKSGTYCLKDTATDSRFNVVSALLAMQLILSGKGNGSIGYISPYRAQTKLVNACIDALLPDNRKQIDTDRVIAATIHTFQGSERDIIIFDQVDSYPQQRPSILLTNSKSDRLINVAVTRAKGKFITIADRQYIKSRIPQEKAVRALSDHLETMNGSYTKKDLPRILADTFHPDLQWFEGEPFDRLARDLKAAKKITISAPFPAKINTKLWQLLQAISRRVDITFITSRKQDILLRSYALIPRDIAMSFIEIDGSTLWVGSPIMHGLSFNSAIEEPYLTCRLAASNVIELLNQFLSLEEPVHSNEGEQQKVISQRPDYSLHQYVATWAQCPNCRSNRKIDVSSNGATKLICSYCGSNSNPRYILEKYMEYVDLRCKSCHSTLDVKDDYPVNAVECTNCKEEIAINTLLS
ncbi:disulfide oxidoreductase [Oceanobacillus piezotolerans]|uniref:Disulfide oxidoreductase n=1 Tax=Oceanobacillus piezotolerans TaxID=2448030 RepID=A0A498DAW3_9BACI|nr:AAA domain-containing protein [Oceanobacillus piezotolerans]RLL48264.1 disulfide oxidoreductase [Oceanobacillus piezotolerans]